MLKIKKKGQLKIQQMMVMIIMVTLFFVLVGMFILVVKVSDLKQKATILQENNAKLLVSKIANSPEFSCGESFGTGMSSCIDADKVMSLKKNIGDYNNGAFWGINGLEIREIYPKPKGVECTSSTFPDCDKIILISNTNGTWVSNFVSLCKKESINSQVYNKCNLAKILVSYPGA